MATPPSKGVLRETQHGWGGSFRLGLTGQIGPRDDGGNSQSSGSDRQQYALARTEHQNTGLELFHASFQDGMACIVSIVSGMSVCTAQPQTLI